MELQQSTPSKPTRTQYYAVDIAKFVFAFIVVAAHMYPFGSFTTAGDFLLIQGIARVVVPFFFLTSAFLFFSRMQPDILKGAQSARSLWRYVERIGIMYFFWTLLINGLLALGYFIHGVRAGIFQLTRNFFLSAAYPFLITSNGRTSFTIWHQGSLDFSGVKDFLYHIIQPFNQYHLWYFPALMLGMVFVYFLLKRFRPIWVVVLGVVLFFLGSPGDAYYGITAYVPVVRVWMNQYISMFYTTRNGVFFATLFLAIGAWLAWNPIKVRTRISQTIFWLAFTGMLIESQILRHFQIQRDYNFYFFSIPAAIFLLLWLKEVSLKPRPIYQWFREASIIIYCSHGIFVIMIPAVLTLFNVTGFLSNSLLKFIYVYGFSVGFAALVLWLEKKPSFQWLRYLH